MELKKDSFIYASKGILLCGMLTKTAILSYN